MYIYTVLPHIVARTCIPSSDFITATKREKYLLVEDSSAIYNLWCWQWIVKAADNKQSTMLYITLYPNHQMRPSVYIRLALIWGNTVYASMQFTYIIIRRLVKIKIFFETSDTVTHWRSSWVNCRNQNKYKWRNTYRYILYVYVYTYSSGMHICNLLWVILMLKFDSISYYLLNTL